MSFSYILSALLGLLGLTLLSIGAGLLASEGTKRRQYTQKATARVRELKQKQTGKAGAPGSIRYYPVFEYRANGQHLRVESKVGSDKPAYQVGDSVEICFDPDSRRDFYIPSDTSAKKVGAFLTALGALCAVSAVITAILR